MIIAALVLSCGGYSSNAQIVVRVRPDRPVIERIVAPSPRHIWVDDDWTIRGGKYEFQGSRWIEPPGAGMRWIPGHWREKRHGWVWVPGHWR
jgi:hypothetical protein